MACWSQVVVVVATSGTMQGHARSSVDAGNSYLLALSLVRRHSSRSLLSHGSTLMCDEGRLEHFTRTAFDSQRQGWSCMDGGATRAMRAAEHLYLLPAPSTLLEQRLA